MRVNRTIRILTTLLCVVLMLPMLIVLVVSVNDSTFLSFPPKQVSLRWFEAFFTDNSWQSALYTSVGVGLLACLIATTVGFLAAYSFVRGRYKGKKLLLSFVLLPLIVPHVITAIALYFLSAPLGLVGNKIWLSVGHSIIALPIVVLILISALQNVDESLELAAQGMGASRIMIFARIVLPLALPGIISAALFSFLTSFDELIIALFLSGLASETLQVRIWNSLIMDAEPIIAAVSSFLILCTIGLLGLESIARSVRAGRSS